MVITCFFSSTSETNGDVKTRKRRASHNPWPNNTKQRKSSLLPTSSTTFRKRVNSLPLNMSHRDSADNDSLNEEDRDADDPTSLLPLISCHPPPTSTSTNNIPTNNNHSKEATFDLPPPCTCPYFGETKHGTFNTIKPASIKIITTSRSFLSHLSDASNDPTPHIGQSCVVATTASSHSPHSSLSTASPPTKSAMHIVPSLSARKLSYSKNNSVVTWDTTKRSQRRGSSFGGARTSLLLTTPTKTQQMSVSPLRRSATLRNHNNIINCDNSLLNNKTIKAPSSPCLFQRTTTIRSHHSRNSSVISRNSSRHGRIIRLEQKATKVLGVVFFTFVILWAPFFVLNLLPSLCHSCEEAMSPWVIDVVTWLGYASSMVNPIFYTIFNKVFRQAFKKVLLCQYNKTPEWRPHR